METGDVITVCLDMDEGTLRFMHNGESRGIRTETYPKERIASLLHWAITARYWRCSHLASDLIRNQWTASRPRGRGTAPVRARAAAMVPPRWLATLHGLLFSSFCEVLVQTLAVTPTDPTTRLAALRKLKQTFDGVASSRKRHEDAKVRAWADEVKGDDAKAVSRTTGMQGRLAPTCGSDSVRATQPGPRPQGQGPARRRWGFEDRLDADRLDAHSAARCRGRHASWVRRERRTGARQRAAWPDGERDFVLSGGVGAGERFMALKIWTSLMSKRFLTSMK